MEKQGWKLSIHHLHKYFSAKQDAKSVQEDEEEPDPNDVCNSSLIKLIFSRKKYRM